MATQNPYLASPSQAAIPINRKTLKIRGDCSPPVLWASKLRPTMVPKRNKRRWGLENILKRMRRNNQVKAMTQEATSQLEELSSSWRMQIPLTAK